METENNERSDPWIITSQYFARTLRECLARLGLEGRDFTRVASIGCGWFTEAEALVEIFGQAKIEGFDQDEKLLARIKRRGLPDRVDVKVVDLTLVESFSGEFYDFMVVRNPDIHRRYDWSKIFENCQRHLRSGGKMIVSCTMENELDTLEEVIGEADLQVIWTGENKNKIPFNQPSVVYHDDLILVAEKT